MELFVQVDELEGGDLVVTPAPPPPSEVSSRGPVVPSPSEGSRPVPVSTAPSSSVRPPVAVLEAEDNSDSSHSLRSKRKRKRSRSRRHRSKRDRVEKDLGSHSLLDDSQPTTVSSSSRGRPTVPPLLSLVIPRREAPSAVHPPPGLPVLVEPPLQSLLEREFDRERPSRSSSSQRRDTCDSSRSRSPRSRVDGRDRRLPEVQEPPRPSRSPVRFPARGADPAPSEGTVQDFLETAEGSAESTFLDVLEWIQEEFPDTVEPSKESRASESQVTACFSDKRSLASLPALPWSRGCTDTLLDVDAVLAGSSTDKPSGPLKAGKPIPPFSFLYKFYKVRGVEGIQAVPLNQSVEDMVPSADQPGLRAARPDVSLEELKAWETSSRRSRTMLSGLDWQISSAVKILQRECEVAPSPALSKALRLLFSAGKSTFQLQLENATSLGNLLLKRRDPVLRKLPKQLSEKDRQALRCSSVSTPKLFDDLVVANSSRNMETTLARDAQLRAANPPGRSAGRSHKSSSGVSKGKSVVVRPDPPQPPRPSPQSRPSRLSPHRQQQQHQAPRFSGAPQGRAAAPGDGRPNQGRQYRGNAARNTRGRRY